MSVAEEFDRAFKRAFVRLYLEAFVASWPGAVDLALVTSDAAVSAEESVGWA